MREFHIDSFLSRKFCEGFFELLINVLLILLQRAVKHLRRVRQLPLSGRNLKLAAHLYLCHNPFLIKKAGQGIPTPPRVQPITMKSPKS